MMKRAATRLVILFLLLGLLVPFTLAIVNQTGSLNVAVNQNNTITVIFSNPATFEPGGGGGGGGGAPSGTNGLGTSTTASHYFDELLENTPYTVSVRSSTILLSRIVFRVTHEAKGVTIRVTHLTDLTGLDVPLPDSSYHVFGFERVDHPGLGDTEIVPTVDVRFNVLRSSLSAANVPVSSVRILRYTSSWKSLPTAVVSQGTNVTFRVSSPGMSIFAVVGVPSTPVSLPSGSETVPTTPPSSSPTGEVTAPSAPSEPSSAPSEPPTTPSSSSKVPIISVVIILVLGGLLGGYYYISKRRSGAATKGASFSDEAFDMAVKESTAPADPVQQLQEYVDKELRRGFHRMEIVAKLRSAGWPDNIINRVLDNFPQPYLEERNVGTPHDDYGQVLTFLEKKLALGYDATVLKNALVKVGWNGTLIDTLLKEALESHAAATVAYSDEALGTVRAFIEKELRSGFSKEQVRAALLKGGWQERMIDDELAKR